MGSNIFKLCRHCDLRFEVSRKWQLFCSNPCRRAWNYLEVGFCFYCGEPGDITRDHIHPVAASSELKRKFNGQETVYSCRECNSGLGAKIFECVEERVKYLIKRYNSKYKLRKNVTWSEGEIEKLGPSLRQRIKSAVVKRQMAERRVIYLQAVLAELIWQNEIVKEEKLATLDNTTPLEDNSEEMLSVEEFTEKYSPKPIIDHQ